MVDPENIRRTESPLSPYLERASGWCIPLYHIFAIVGLKLILGLVLQFAATQLDPRAAPTVLVFIVRVAFVATLVSVDEYSETRLNLELYIHQH